MNARFLVAAALLAAGCSRTEESGVRSVPRPTPADTVEYAAHGNEPFWSVTVTPQGIVYRDPENIDGVRGPSVRPVRQGTSLVFRTQLRDEKNTQLELTLEEQPCNDSMSDRGFAFRAVARLGDRVLEGCAEQRPAAPLGDWIVGGHRIPGASAMNDDQAMVWHGRSARFTSGIAIFDADTCRTPVYDARELRGDSLLAVDYHADPAVFGLKPGASIRRIEVRCDTMASTGPGAVLLEMPSGTLFTVWDGVFFELRRNVPSP